MPKTTPFRLDYTLELLFDQSGLPQAVRIDAEPGEHEAAQRALETAVAGLAALKHPTTLPATSAAPARAAVTLSKGVGEFMRRKDLKPTTLASYATKLAYLVEQAGGETSLLDIDQLRFVKLAEVILDNGAWSDKTKSVYITMIGGFLNWHRLRNGLSLLTAATLKPKRTAPSALDRDAFTLDQLRMIFQHAATRRLSEPHKYWATVATAFLGCRIEELAQVNIGTDLKHDVQTNVWYFDFAETPDADGVLRKSLKRLTSWRHAPIHSALVRHGFIDYLKAQLEGRQLRPFESAWKPHIGKPAANGQPNSGLIKWSHKITKWGGDTLAELVEAGSLPAGTALTYFHSMRHTFADTLAAAKVTEEYRAAIQGQAFGGMNAQTYAKLRQNHNALSETIETALGCYAELLL
ncbi:MULTISPECIES: hypothetical protein [unclassified Caballeronia]|uniref:hypothetical protein n=1 Tax=unclassified Caballeronia TaxID=2646786 RepID=UPI002859A8C3|nr:MULTISPECIES: hypothetical protein [unclassified Caballeronia]MDR5736591.1 hypothetical protein [Caballeronia sp. LZ016]MDR5810930.1 hypothetical protein [Caballeronia sp. LZ019]